jgi:hypothetical protein
MRKLPRPNGAAVRPAQGIGVVSFCPACGQKIQADSPVSGASPEGGKRRKCAQILIPARILGTRRELADSR